MLRTTSSSLGCVVGVCNVCQAAMTTPQLSRLLLQDRNQRGRLPLHVAVAHASVRSVVCMVSIRPETGTQTDFLQETPLNILSDMRPLVHTVGTHAMLLL